MRTNINKLIMMKNIKIIKKIMLMYFLLKG